MKNELAHLTPDLTTPCAPVGHAFGPEQSFIDWLDALPRTLAQQTKLAAGKDGRWQPLTSTQQN